MEFPINIDLGANGGAHKFRSVDDLRIFVDRELNAWSWLPQAYQNIGNYNGSVDGFNSAWNRHHQAIQNCRTNLDQGTVDQAWQFFQNYFEAPNSLPVSESARGAAVLGIRENIGQRAGLGALAAILGLRFDGNDSEQVRGLIAANEFIQGTGSVARQGVQTALAALLKRFSEQQLRVEEKADAVDAQILATERARRDQFARLLKIGNRWRKTFSGGADAKILALQSDVDASIDSIRLTEKTYSELMGLKAPVSYWTDKAKEHRRNSTVAMWIGLAFAAALTIYAFVDGMTRTLDLVKKSVTETGQVQIAYVVLTIVVFLLTIAFWIGRLISRTYVSQSHLAIDAEERAIMVQTYLALTNDNKIETSERSLVLAALFRASSDGLVKDDASPDMSIAGIASRLGAGPGAGQR